METILDRAVSLDTELSGFTSRYFMDGEELFEGEIAEPILVMNIDPDTVVTKDRCAEIFSSCRSLLKIVLPTEEVAKCRMVSHSQSYDVTSSGEQVRTGFNYLRCDHKHKNKKTAKHDDTNDDALFDVQEKFKYLHTLRVGESMSDTQLIHVRECKDDEASAVGAGRVRGSNVNRLRRIFSDDPKTRLPEDFVDAYHLRTKRLRELLNRIRPDRSWDSKQFTEDGLRSAVLTERKATSQLFSPQLAAKLVAAWSEDKKKLMKEQLQPILFRQLNTGFANVHMANGVVAEANMIKRIKQHGLRMTHPATLRSELATISDINDQALLISSANQSIAVRTDLLGIASFADGITCSIIIEFKYVKQVKPTYDKLVHSYRTQVQAQLLASRVKGTPMRLFVIQGNSSELEDEPGTTCTLTTFEVKPDECMQPWIERYSALAHEIMKLLDSTVFDNKMTLRPAFCIEDPVVRNGYSKRVCACKATPGYLRYTDDALNALSKQTKYNRLKKGVYLCGTVRKSHTGHRAIAEHNFADLDAAKCEEIIRRYHLVGYNSGHLAAELGIPRQDATNILNKLKAAERKRQAAQMNSSTTAATTDTPSHSLERALAALHRESDNIAMIRYLEVPQDSPLTTDLTRCGRFIDVLWIGQKSYDVSGISDSPFSYAEYIVWATQAQTPTEVDPNIKPINMKDVRVCEGFTLRAECLFWAYSKDVRDSVTCHASKFCDGTFGTSNSDTTFVALVGTDAEHNTICNSVGLIRRQTQENFRLWIQVFLLLCYGKSLAVWDITVTDGQDELRIASEYHQRFHGRCLFHAVLQQYIVEYGARHGPYDGGVGSQAKACAYYILRDSETKQEAESRWTRLFQWLATASTADKAFLKNSAAFAAMDMEDRPPKNKANDNEGWNITGVFGHEHTSGTTLLRVQWKGFPHNADTWERLELVEEMLGKEFEAKMETFEGLPAEKLTKLPPTIPASKLGNDNSNPVNADGTFVYTPIAIFRVISSQPTPIVRVGWEGYGQRQDTYETLSSLKEKYDPDVIHKLLAEYLAALEGDSTVFDDLPTPDCNVADELSASRTGFTAHRRAVLLRFLTVVRNLHNKIGLSTRTGVLHLDQYTSNRVERRFELCKYHGGGAFPSGKKKKRVNKKCGTDQIVIVTRQIANQDRIERLARAARAAGTSPTARYLNGAISLAVARSLTRRAVSLVLEQSKVAKAYTCLRCVCSDDIVFLLTYNGPTPVAPPPLTHIIRTRRIQIIGKYMYCSCCYTAGNGIPCRHILRMLIHVFGLELSLKHFNLRWWIEFYRATDAVKDLLWKEGGYFDQHATLDQPRRKSRIYLGSFDLTLLDKCVDVCDSMNCEHSHTHVETPDSDDDLGDNEFENIFDEQPIVETNSFNELKDMMHNAQALLTQYPEEEQEAMEDLREWMDRLNIRIANKYSQPQSSSRDDDLPPQFFPPPSHRRSDKRLGAHYMTSSKKKANKQAHQ